MLGSARLFLFTIAALLLQVTVLPAYLRDPFKPNLILVLIVYLALRVDMTLAGGVLAYLLGLVNDAYSGIFHGLSGFSYLFIYAVLRKVADQLYADSSHLLVVVVFVATVVNGLLQLVLLQMFSAADGVYATLLASLIPQALVNALVASLLAGLIIIAPTEDQR
jgi:rod shape-determining protein MreD